MPRLEKIVIAEDDYASFVLTCKYLERWGIRTPKVHLNDGQEVLDFFGNTPDNSPPNTNNCLLLLDINMPKVDGITILKNLNKTSQNSPVSIIALSSSSNPDTIQECMKSGCDEYFTKPIEKNAFFEALNRLSLNP